jgi:hypothetical protein
MLRRKNLPAPGRLQDNAIESLSNFELRASNRDLTVCGVKIFAGDAVRRLVPRTLKRWVGWGIVFDSGGSILNKLFSIFGYWVVGDRRVSGQAIGQHKVLQGSKRLSGVGTTQILLYCIQFS